MSDLSETNKEPELENSDTDAPPVSKVDDRTAVKANRYKATYPIVITSAVITPLVFVIPTYGFNFERILIGVIPAIVFGTIGHFVWWLFCRKSEAELEFHNKLSLIFIGFVAGVLPSLVAITSN